MEKRTHVGKTAVFEKETGEDVGFADVLIGALRSLPLTLGVGAICLVLAALGAYLCPDPDRMTLPFGLAGLALTALSGGWAAGRKARTGALWTGLVGGALFLLLLLAFAFCVPDEWKIGNAGILGAAGRTAVIPIEVLGAFLGKKRISKRHNGRSSHSHRHR